MQGKVKFYSSEKGFGFIHSIEHGDVYFHITAVNGAEPPKVGDVVQFNIGINSRTNKESACDVEILQGTENRNCDIEFKSYSIRKTFYPDGGAGTRQSKKRTINGFPCIRGSCVNGFKVERSLGRITVGNGLFESSKDSANEAREELIKRAEQCGANAVLNYVWHNDRRRYKGIILGFWHYENNFWAEGEAVVLVADS